MNSFTMKQAVSRLGGKQLRQGQLSATWSMIRRAGIFIAKGSARIFSNEVKTVNCEGSTNVILYAPDSGARFARGPEREGLNPSAYMRSKP